MIEFILNLGPAGTFFGAVAIVIAIGWCIGKLQRRQDNKR